MGFWKGSESILLNGSYQLRIYSLHDIYKPELQKICDWLYTNFSNRPRLTIAVDDLLYELDTMVVVYSNLEIVGTVRHKHLSDTIYLIDCFCVHRSVRRKGIADMLLSTIKEYANQRDRRKAVFLKEGAPLFIPQLPFYSSTYVYRAIIKRDTSAILSVPTRLAHILVDTYCKIYPNTFLIVNKETANQHWRMYRAKGQFILACFQDTSQRLYNKTMGWMTVLLKNMWNSSIINQMVDSVPMFDYVWMDSRHLLESGNWERSNDWKKDGAFHWYRYQWINEIKTEFGGIMI